MSRRGLIGLATVGALGAIAALGVVQWLQPPSSLPATRPATHAITAAAPQPAPGPAPAPEPGETGAASSPAQSPALAAPPAPSAPATDQPPAHWSMADARERGDERTPPLHRTPELPPASAWELADPSAYARREADLQARARADYVRAADTYLPELAEGIARGRAAGVPAEAIAKMEIKRQRLQALRDELANAAHTASP